MNLNRTKKTVVITGGNKRIGASIARTYAKLGYNIIITFKSDAESSQKTKNECQNLGCSSFNSICTIFDNTSNLNGSIDLFFEELNHILKEANQNFSDLSLFVNNASYFNYDNIDTIDTTMFDNFDKSVHTNFIAPVKLILKLYNLISTENLNRPREAILTHTNNAPLVVNIVDQKVKNLDVDYLSYTISKVALDSMTKLLAKTTGPLLRVNAVSPGLTFSSPDIELANIDLKKLQTNTVLGYSNCAQDICDTIHFLEKNKSITGQNILVDGGQHLVSPIKNK